MRTCGSLRLATTDFFQIKPRMTRITRIATNVPWRAVPRRLTQHGDAAPWLQLLLVSIRVIRSLRI